MSAALTAMTVAGIMSGTSADGIDVAFTRITPQPDDPAAPALKLLGHAGFPFPPALRRAVLAAMNADAIATAELARLNWRLGQAYCEALAAALERHPCRLDLIGCHGQTIYHQATPARYLGREFSCTWQIGEMAMMAQQSGVPVVSNFRPADMVVGGQGAPLVPLLDYVLFRHPTRGRVLQNLGGIGNLTALPPNAGPMQVVAFDTGPGNMVIDQLMQQLFGKRFDRGGKTAARGAVIKAVVSARLRETFFRHSHRRRPAGSNSAATTQPVSLRRAAKRAAAGKMRSPRQLRSPRIAWARPTPTFYTSACARRRSISLSPGAVHAT
jgi:anhydro-N-acetylmuramic acid kinase